MPYLAGLVDANHWSYVAAAMAAGIKKHGSAKDPHSPVTAPRAVLIAARDFFETVTEAFGGADNSPTNPLETACNYSIAASAVRRTKQTCLARAELNTTLRQYSDLVQKIIDQQPVEMEELELLDQLGDFFEDIADAGEREAYDGYVAMGYYPHSR